MTLKERLIQEIEQASEESLEQFFQLWQQNQKAQSSLSTFFQTSPLAVYCAEQELDISRDKSGYGDRFEL
ncbi:hypothetical protein [[Limnothrix rosea] IAM M-220]|uniref:hypothetical protein n=1 Tax=[Limnothrix rosea] IAM M-220 TaxID=454133 RepID=UPI00095DFFD3|nr:hypothetical protein [[Limnothrix rosea] IAM M-220]OKH14678.1 hypothetical protein NIES208_13570 [[Limnothrix rosea] IAM M-220]